MCAWAQDKGAVATVICQHHASEQPLCGGIPPQLAWPSLQAAAAVG